MAVQQAPGVWRTDLQQHDLSADGHEVATYVEKGKPLITLVE